ncbi:MAG: MFS transporter [Oscillospiraceae bacterium]|nr:MFS transporter [Oscillospiraceae bacterium]
MRDDRAGSANVFSNRNFCLCFIGALISGLGSVLYSFAVSFYILEISSNNAFLQGLYLAACGAALVLATPLGGVLGDRFNKARIMTVCDFIKGGIIILSVIMMTLFSSARAQTVILFISGFTGEFVTGIFSPASSALMPFILDDSQLQQAEAYSSVRSSLLSIAGTALAGILYAVLPLPNLLLSVGVCSILSGLAEMFIRYEQETSGEKMNGGLFLADIKDGFSYLRSQTAIMALMTSILFINFFISPIGNNFIPYFIKTDVENASSYIFDGTLTPEMWSSVFGILVSAGTIMGSLLLSISEQKERCGRKTALRLCLLSAVFVAITAGYWILVARAVSLNLFLVMFSISLFIIGLLIGIVSISMSTAIVRMLRKDKLSKASSILTTLSLGLTPLSSVAGGIILQYLGSPILLSFCSVGFTAAALLLLFNREIDSI